MSDGQVVIDIDGNDAGFKRAMGGIGKITAAGMAVAAAGIATAVAGLAAFAVKGVGLASSLQEVQNVVDVTFGDNAADINSWSKTAGSAFGLSELSAKQYTSTLGAMFKSQGIGAEATAEMSTSLAGLAGDMASFYNLDPTAAFDKLRAGISGESEPLKQLGIDVSDAALAQYALSQGISKSTSDMTAAEKSTLRYGLIMQQTSDVQGDFARTSDSFANQQRILQMQIDTLAATLGVSLMPVLSSLLGTMIPAVEALGPAMKQVGDGLAALLNNDPKGAALLGDGLSTIATSLVKGIGGVLPGLVTALSSVVVEIAKVLPSLLPPLATAFINGFATLATALPEIVPGLVTAVLGIVDALVAALPVILPALAEGGVLLITGLVKGLSDNLPTLLPIITDAILLMVDQIVLNEPLMVEAGKALLEGLEVGLQAAIPALLQAAVALLATLITAVAEIFGIHSPSTVFADIGKQLIDGLKLGVTTAWTTVSTWFADMKSKVVGLLAGAAGWLLTKGSEVIAGLKSGITTAWTGARDWIAGIKDKVITAVGSLGTLLKDQGRAIIQGLWDGMKALWNDAKGWVSGIADWIAENKGPISKDRKLLKPAGLAIMDGLLKGLKDGWKPVSDLLDTYTADISGSMASTIASTLAVSPGFVPAGYAVGAGTRSIARSAMATGRSGDTKTEMSVVVQNPMGSYSDGLRAWRDIQEGVAWS